MDDNFEIEVTNLNTGATSRHPMANNMPEPPDHDEDDAPTRERSVAARWRRGVRVAIISSVVLLAVALAILFNPTAKSSLYTVFHFPTPVPSPTPLPGANLVYLIRGAPWGSIALDGKQPSRASYANLGMSISWVRLAHGHHRLVITQTPFPALRCTISYPAAKSDTCPLVSPFSDNTGDPAYGYGQYSNLARIAPGARFVDLGARFSQLPRDAQDALVAAVTATLSPPSPPLTLQPGDHYVRDDATMAIARTTLQATFIPTVLSPANAVDSNSQSCVSFCDLSGANVNGGGTWDMRVALMGSWHITAQDGQVLAEHAPMFVSNPIYDGIPPTSEAIISILWTGTWQVSAGDGFGGQWSPVCQVAQQMISGDINVKQVTILGMLAQPGSTPEQGCALSISLSAPNQSNPADILYRFGDLLAANDVAHRAFPELPLASANEQAQARQLLARLNG